MSVKILRCDCRSEFMDKEYGKQLRVHNATNDVVKKGYRCVVCAKLNK